MKADVLTGRRPKIREKEEFDSYSFAQENLIQWGIPFGFLFKSRFALFFFSFLSNHYVMTYKQLTRYRCILDVGCGLGLPMRCLRQLGLRSEVIGVDVCVRYLQRVKKLEIYDDLVLASAKCLPFKKKSFDSLMCLQVLEHLTKRDGVTALGELSRVAETVIITTPVDFVEADVNPANPYQKHLSGWVPRDMRHVGYKVTGYGWIRLPFCPLLLSLLNFILLPFLRHFPEIAYYMQAVKLR